MFDMKYALYTCIISYLSLLCSYLRTLYKRSLTSK